MKTKEKIVLASLDLFNERGERNVSTNHIASHLNMSPGNLYYHYRNKQDIIYEIFKNYELLVDTYLQIPEGRSVDLDDLASYLEASFQGLWAYRFLHRDLEHLMESDERLRKEYQAFTFRCVESIKSIICAMMESGVYIHCNEVERSTRALNTWLIVTNWMTYLKTIYHGQEMSEDEGAMAREAIQHGIYQVLDFILPYITEEKLEEAKAIHCKYQFDKILPDHSATN